MPDDLVQFDIYARSTISIGVDQLHELKLAATAAGFDSVADLLQHDDGLWWDSADWAITVAPATPSTANGVEP